MAVRGDVEAIIDGAGALEKVGHVVSAVDDGRNVVPLKLGERTLGGILVADPDCAARLGVDPQAVHVVKFVGRLAAVEAEGRAEAPCLLIKVEH